MAKKWLVGAAALRIETVPQPFIKIPGKRADELISKSLYLTKRKELSIDSIIVYFNDVL
jgi:hypothetical protein